MLQNGNEKKNYKQLVLLLNYRTEMIHLRRCQRFYSQKYLHIAHGVGESRSLFPSGHHNDSVTGLDEAACFSETNTELYTIINILQPVISSWYCEQAKKSVN